MAIANNNHQETTYKNLSIQISLNGLSFCVLENNSIQYLKHFYTEKKTTPLKMLDMLVTVFKTEAALDSAFDNITVIHVNELATLVPKALFNEENLADYLKFNSKILKSDFVAYDEITVNESINVYIPYVNANNFIYEKFGTFSYKHVSTILIEQILTAEKHSKTPRVYININPAYFEIVAIENGQLKLYNSFEFETKEDFIYYVLFTLEQLHFNPETIETILLGTVSKDDNIYSIIYKYIRHVVFGKRFDRYSYFSKPDSEYSDFTLIHSF